VYQLITNWTKGEKKKEETIGTKQNVRRGGEQKASNYWILQT
jgi:hypothetical protein